MNEPRDSAPARPAQRPGRFARRAADPAGCRQRRAPGSWPGRASAQALVEFALILPLALILLLGMFDLGRALVFGVAVQQGAREAARLGSRAASTPSITDQVILQRLIDASAPALVGCSPTSAQQSCGGGSWTFTVSPAGTPKSSGTQLTVTARGSVSLFVGFLTGAMGLGLGQITVQGQAAMVVF